jgi:phosphoglycerate dehydrogenase-like enzyme
VSSTFAIGITRDFYAADGSLDREAIGLDLLDAAPEVSWTSLPTWTPEVEPGRLEGLDGLYLRAGRLTAASLGENPRIAVVVRFGAGFEKVDVAACTSRGVAVVNSPDGTRRAVATAVVLFVLALSHRLLIKNEITRTGRWEERTDFEGIGLVGRTFGQVGLGNIGREVLGLLAPFGMRHLACDPYASPEVAKALGADLVDLDTLLGESDFVSLSTPLTSETKALIGPAQLRRMKRTAFLINTSRGAVVNQGALYEALRDGVIRGAAIDAWATEPVPADEPILTLDNVITTPHAICFTDQMSRDTGVSACRSLLEVAAGRVPHFVVNPEVLEESAFRAKLAAFAARA